MVVCVVDDRASWVAIDKPGGLEVWGLEAVKRTRIMARINREWMTVLCSTVKLIESYLVDGISSTQPAPCHPALCAVHSASL